MQNKINSNNKKQHNNKFQLFWDVNFHSFTSIFESMKGVLLYTTSQSASPVKRSSLNVNVHYADCLMSTL